ncbi:MAG: hypothetical protein JW705_08335 [Methanosarcinaceae archaeon]|nr:hypothetical protein [Methanosarcinaceae archaeon]
MVPPAFAEVSFKNDIDILDSSVSLTVLDEYCGSDAETLREELDKDISGFVEADEVETFRNSFLENKSFQFQGYLEVDGNSTSFKISSVDLQMKGAEGVIDDSPLYVTTKVIYEVDTLLSTGDHTIWVIGHPLIEDVKVSLPEGVTVQSCDGIENASWTTEDGRPVIRGSSGVRSFIVEDRPTFEYAMFLEFSKEPFYREPFFIPLLLLLELILALLGLYIIKMNKIK